MFFIFFSFFQIFLIFFISFFHFFFISSFFLFFQYFFFSFECVSSLTSVSEFNCRCFLRSRYSMEMWCPDDMGRDSWDSVPPPAWERACFSSPEWSGGSSPVKTEALQIVLLLFGTLFGVCMCTPHLRALSLS